MINSLRIICVLFMKNNILFKNLKLTESRYRSLISKITQLKNVIFKLLS